MTTTYEVVFKKNAFTDDEIRELETVHKRIAPFVYDEEGESFSFVVKKADKLQWKTFRAGYNDDDKKADALEQLVKACVIAVAFNGEKVKALEPEEVPKVRALLDRLLSEFPAATDSGALAKTVLKLNGQVSSRGK